MSSTGTPKPRVHRDVDQLSGRLDRIEQRLGLDLCKTEADIQAAIGSDLGIAQNDQDELGRVAAERIVKLPTSALQGVRTR